MIHIFNILFFLFLLFPIQKDPRYNKQGKPSTYGINTYVKDNQSNIIKEYEYLIDSLYDVYIYTENISETSDEGELGQFYLPDYIVITNEEKYIAYEFKYMSKFKQKSIPYNERTVKAVIFHELTHAYFNQVMINMRNNNQYTSPEYGSLRMFPDLSTRFGAIFIEEGICEYMVYYFNEANPIKDVPIPVNEDELLSDSNRTNNLYYYSVVFLKDFLDKYGIHKGMEILISNKPPTSKEILNPKLFFKRLL
jgi:hypothetical protein